MLIKQLMANRIFLYKIIQIPLCEDMIKQTSSYEIEINYKSYLI